MVIFRAICQIIFTICAANSASRHVVKPDGTIRRLTQVNRILLLAVCDVYVISSLTWTVWATHYVRICENQDLQIAQLDCMHHQAIWPAWQISQRNLQIARNTMVIKVAIKVEPLVVDMEYTGRYLRFALSNFLDFNIMVVVLCN